MFYELKKCFYLCQLMKLERYWKWRTAVRVRRNRSSTWWLESCLGRKSLFQWLNQTLSWLWNQLIFTLLISINIWKIPKADIIADFICISNNGIIITTNCLASPSELSRIEDFLKKIDNINLDLIEGPHLPKSKSFMKIIGLFYNSKWEVLTPDFIKGVLKEIHLFKDVMLASKPCVIKVFSKSNMAVVWVDIWDFQNNSLAKNIINCCFNIGQFVVTIQGTNMNPDIS